MTRTRRPKKQPVKEAPAAAATPEPEAPAAPVPLQRPASPEEVAQIQLQQQRGRAEIAVLKQRFAETDVAMTIAQAEVAQLVRQNQALQQENDRLREELASATDGVETDKEDNSEKESDDGQTSPAELPQAEA